MVAIRIQTRMNFWFGFIFLLIMSVLFSLIGISFLSSNMDMVKNGTYAKATVIELVKHTSSKSTTYYPVIEYKTSTGELIRTQSSSGTGSNPNAYKAGDKINIIYSKSDPNKFIFDKFFNKYGFPVIFIFAGILCLLLEINLTVRKIRFGV